MNTTTGEFDDDAIDAAAVINSQSFQQPHGFGDEQFNDSNSNVVNEMDPDGLISVAELGDEYASTFNFEYFNPMQAEMLDPILNSNKNVVVVAPTGNSF
jgi:superfamily II DNA or RNA helicase